MLRSLTARQFLDWHHYDSMEPFGELRADYRTADIVATLINLQRDRKKKPEPYKLAEVVLKFGEKEVDEAKKPKQDWKEQKRVMMMWVAAAGGTFTNEAPK